jgi:hypothetical protein
MIRSFDLKQTSSPTEDDPGSCRRGRGRGQPPVGHAAQARRRKSWSRTTGMHGF